MYFYIWCYMAIPIEATLESLELRLMQNLICKCFKWTLKSLNFTTCSKKYPVCVTLFFVFIHKNWKLSSHYLWHITSYRISKIHTSNFPRFNSLSNLYWFFLWTEAEKVKEKISLHNITCKLIKPTVSQRAIPQRKTKVTCR